MTSALSGARHPQPEPDSGAFTYGVLGPLLVTSRGHPVPITSPKSRVILASLVLAAGSPVSIDRLLEAAYGDRVPAHPANALQQLAGRLRRVLSESGLGDHIVTSGSGYRLDVPREDTDVGLVDRLRRRADEAARRDDLTAELTALGEALKLWRGLPLADVDSEALRWQHLPGLTERRVQLEERRTDVALALHREADVIEALLELTREQPLRETPWAQLMMALHALGRRADAIDAYERAQGHLRKELGIEPGALLQSTHQRILDNLSPAPATIHLVPRQLPAEPMGFAGRHADVRIIQAAFDTAPDDRPVLVSISGMPGVGKTSLAIHVARRVAARFPDGQLWLNLRGTSGASSETSQDALPSLIRALGHPTMVVPRLPDEQASLLRSILDKRRVLMVFDDARNAEQVRPLLPAASGCAAIISSRTNLAGLTVTDGALHVPLLPLPDEDARKMLSHRLGREKVDADHAATTRLLHRTGRLPLALAVVAARAAAQPDASLGDLDGQLAGAGSRLDAFISTDERSNLRAVFSWSYESVSRPAARVFRLFGLHPTPDLTLDAAVSLTGQGDRVLHPLVQELLSANLVGPWAGGRLVLHDLLHAFAAELADVRLTPRERSSAVRRTLDHYAHTAEAAADLIVPVRDRATPLAAAGAAVTTEFDDAEAAATWFTQNRKALLACPDLALSHGLLPHAWRTGWAVADLLVSTAAWECLETHLETVLRAAERDAADHAIARAHQLLGRAHRHLDHPERAAIHLTQAFTAALATGDTMAQARAMTGLATLAEDREDWATSLLHDRATLALAEAEGLRGIVAETLNHVGWDLAQLGRFREAAAYCTRSLVVAQELGHRRAEAAAWDSLGLVNRRRGRLSDALTTYTRALQIRRELDHQVGVGKTHIALGDTYADLGSSLEAAGHWQAGIEILDRVSPVRARSERRRLAGLVDVAGPR